MKKKQHRVLRCKCGQVFLSRDGNTICSNCRLKTSQPTGNAKPADKQIGFTDNIEFWISGVAIPVGMVFTYKAIDYQVPGSTHYTILN